MNSLPILEKEQIQSQVIEQFGNQWTRFPANEGYYGSKELFADLLGNLAKAEDFQGKCVAEIGSGSGRIINMLAAVGAKEIVAIEPSEAMLPLKKNTQAIAERVVYLQERGESWSHPNLDYIVCFGVLHHIVDPLPVVHTALRNLKPGGKFVVWLYGREGNELYLRLVAPLRALTPKLPDFLLNTLARTLLIPLDFYIWLCRSFPLPMRDYMLNHVGKLDRGSRIITIYDQLNPSWAKYYRRDEAESLLRDNGFKDVESFHRHGYSWTVIGTAKS